METMKFLSNKPLLITDTILRDAHQSQAATRMTIDDMLPALEKYPRGPGPRRPRAIE